MRIRNASARSGDTIKAGGRARWVLAAFVLIGLAGSALEARAQFAFALGDTQADDGQAIAIDAAGNTTIVGRFRQTVDFDPGAGTAALTATATDNFVASYDASGGYRYAFSLGGGATFSERGIGVDGSGNIYVTGWFSGIVDFDPGPGIANLNSVSGSFFLASYDSNGAYIFAFNLDSGVNGELGAAIAVDAAGNSYLTGFFSGIIDFDPSAGNTLVGAVGNADMFVASYTSIGALRFAFGAGGSLADEGLGIAIDGSGNSYVTGSFNGSVDFDPSAGVQTLTSNGSRDVFLASYTSVGGFRYALGIGDTGTDIGNGVAVDAAGNAFVTGQFQGAADFDPGAGTVTVTSAGDDDVFLASYTNTGVLRFAFGIGATGGDRGFGATVDASGNVFISGDFRNSPDFDPGPGTQTIQALGNLAAFVAGYTNTGAYRTAYAFTGFPTSTATGVGVVLDAAGRPHVVGTFGGTIDFDPGAGATELTTAGSNDVFLSSFALLPPTSPVPALGPLGIVGMVALLGVLGARRR